ncbi:hypothetical protein LTR53_009779 [Teratosphaeriaceae sp. CCFEE 6253]|nr:hypothetical protein LTR53_009779 [Teratosphaeriaceae sp. CCFEE 6253]
MAGQEAVFQKYTAEDAAKYAIGRAYAYPEVLYQSILDWLVVLVHQGPRTTALDVGTGPGKVVWDLLQHFPYVIGCDAGPGMIAHARSAAAAHHLTDRTTFTVTPAETCAAAVTATSRATVDLITVATAAHWFDLPRFYASAATALRPGGMLALWILSSSFIHPAVPHAREIQAELAELEDDVLRPYWQLPGTLYARNGYDDLPLPWTDAAANPGFERESFQRVEWDRHGNPSAPPLPDGSPGPFQMGREVTFAQAELGLATSSSVVRWRAAHPGKVGTAEDVVQVAFRKIREIVGEVEALTVAPSCSLLLMRRA